MTIFKTVFISIEHKVENIVYLGSKKTEESF